MTVMNRAAPRPQGGAGARTGARAGAPVRTGLIRLRVSDQDPGRRELSDGEVELLGLIAAGGTKDEIARHLGMAPSTVSNHVSRIYRALGARNAPHAVALGHGYRVIPARPLPTAPHVSRRERQVLAGMAHGLTTEQVAVHLALSGETVKAHLARVYRKLEVGCRAGAVDAAICQRLLVVVVDQGGPAGGGSRGFGGSGGL